MRQEPGKTWSRDPERSREMILEAAERLFAAKGYEETSLQEIGQSAGVSRGTPGYFFGSKEQLYGAVLDRVVQAEFSHVTQTLTPEPRPDRKSEDELAEIIGNFLDFLLARPTFIQLIEREAVNQARVLQGRSAYLGFLQQALELFGPGLANPRYRPLDPAQLILSITALCWFPIAHTDTILRPLGIQPDPAFWQARKQHIIDLVLHGLLARPDIK